MDKIFKQVKFDIIGKTNQVLNVVLFPNQSIYVEDTQVICCSENIKKAQVKQGFCDDSAKHSPLNWKFTNSSKGLEYLTINNRGGGIVALNSLLMKDMLFHEDYVLAHTINVSLKSWK